MDATLDDVGNFTGLISSGQSYPFGYDPLNRLIDLSQGSSVLEHFDDDAASFHRKASSNALLFAGRCRTAQPMS